MSLHGTSSSSAPAASSAKLQGNVNSTSQNDNEADLQSALQMSMATAQQTVATNSSTASTTTPGGGGGGMTDEYASMLMFEGDEMEDPELAMALQFSLQER